MDKVINFKYGGYNATVIVPENANGEWIWKTEFLYAFEQAEVALLGKGYTRVYYEISDKYGSYKAVRLMYNFYKYVSREFGLRDKCHLFGFSRGGLYAFNFALFYPECVASLYLDAPVLDMKSWPLAGSKEQKQLFDEYSLTEETLKIFKENPVDNLGEFFDTNIPVLVIAGEVDELVPLKENAGVLLDYCEANGIALEYYVKPTCGHHPHSLEDVEPIVQFVKRNSVR